MSNKQSITESILKRRIEFAIDYANEKGWIKYPEKLLHEQLTFEQILEIRSQKEWIEVPGIIEKELRNIKKIHETLANNNASTKSGNKRTTFS